MYIYVFKHSTGHEAMDHPLQHPATPCNTFQNFTATHCNTLHRAARHANPQLSQHTRRSGDIMGFFLTNWVWFTVLPLPPPSPLLARAPPPPPPLSLLSPAPPPSHRPPSLPDTRELDLEAESFVWNGTNLCAAWLRLVLSTDTAIVPLRLVTQYPLATSLCYLLFDL